ncbi:MAG: YicC family protein [Gammaproteobacteria bacterium]|nr:YicC family protein [Gammaproteobacteria bacterium]
MIKSMTAFTRLLAEGEWGNLTLELKSVNQRYLEIQPRLPDRLRPLEIPIRSAIQGRLSRGKVECSIHLSLSGDGSRGLAIDRELVKSIATSIHQVDAILYNPAAISALDVLNWPGVIQTETIDEEQLQQTVLDLLEQGLQQMIAGREREGEKIATMLGDRIEALRQVVATVETRLPQVLAQSQQRLRSRLEELKSELNQERLEQEMAIIANRLDVDEELDRLRCHLEEVERLLQSKKSVGRRLDFLMQELNREANTLGSKSGDIETTRASVEMKVLIEQMREQIQNIE